MTEPRPVNPDCPHCRGAGELRWQQPGPDGVLREVTHPCPARCGPGWRHPAAERHRVVEPLVDEPAPVLDARRPATRARGGQAEASQQLDDAFAALLEAAIRGAGGTIHSDPRTP